jgi:hypothetical protein
LVWAPRGDRAGDGEETPTPAPALAPKQTLKPAPDEEDTGARTGDEDTLSPAGARANKLPAAATAGAGTDDEEEDDTPAGEAAVSSGDGAGGVLGPKNRVLRARPTGAPTASASAASAAAAAAAAAVESVVAGPRAGLAAGAAEGAADDEEP